ncbi:hypothetical protein H1C71_033612 [Ictidomys tridecemlineatus]|nr:hypothetical protein H1C71_033612 [Ictidomys tridecemlineatus]
MRPREDTHTRSPSTRSQLCQAAQCPMWQQGHMQLQLVGSACTSQAAELMYPGEDYLELSLPKMGDFPAQVSARETIPEEAGGMDPTETVKESGDGLAHLGARALPGDGGAADQGEMKKPQ